MIERRMDLWDYHRQGGWIVITTNGTVKTNGEAVMGRGCAQEAKRRFPHLPRKLGHAIAFYGNVPFIFEKERLVTFPVKHRWWESATIPLIVQSAYRLKAILDKHRWPAIAVPHPGCGNGQLDWPTVRPHLEPLWDDRFILVDKPQAPPS